MGLRELKAERTRDTITDQALGLFERHGYEATTVEEIADAAGVGVATVYRYFPSKDLILLGPLALSIGGLARLLDQRPQEESLNDALRYVVEDVLANSNSQSPRNLRLRAQLDRASGPRARLWDLWASERALLEQAIAHRLALDPGAIEVGVAARTTMMVLEMALDMARSQAGAADALDQSRRMIAYLSSTEAPFRN